MSEKVFNLNADAVTIDQDGRVVISDPEIKKLIDEFQGSDKKPSFGFNIGCQQGSTPETMGNWNCTQG